MASHRADDTAPSCSDLNEEIILKKEFEDTDTDCIFVEEIYSAPSGSLNVFSTVSCVGNADETLEESASSPARQLTNVPLSEDFHTDFYNKNSSIHEVLTMENEKLVLLGIEIEENDCAVILSQEPNTTEKAAANDTGSKSNSNNVKTKRKKRLRKPVKKKNNSALKSLKKNAPLPSKKSRSKHNTNTITVDRVRDMLKARDEIESDAEEEPGNSKLGSRILLKVQDCEFPFNRNIALDFIRMGFKDMEFQYLMIYKDTFTDYILLRPLVSNFSVQDISLELFKIFADFGIPNIVEVNAFYVSDVSNAVKTIQKSFNIGEIIVKGQMLPDGQIVSDQGKDVKKRLLKWTEIEENNHWAIGCYVIQQCLNKKITASDPFSPYIKVFAKNQVRTKRPKETNFSEPCQNINENQIADTEKVAYIVTRNQSKLKSNSSEKKVKPKVVTKTRKKLQKENTNIIKPVTDSSLFKTKFANRSTDAIIEKNVQNDSNSNLNSLLIDTTRDKRKKRTKILQFDGIKSKRKSSPAMKKIGPQPSMSFESYSGLDKILNVSNIPDTESSSSSSLIDVEKIKKCEKCGKEKKDGVRCLNCKTETIKQTIESTHSFFTRLKRYMES